MIHDQRRFVLWKLIQKPGKPKPDKVPVNTGGEAIDAQAPEHWLTFAEAKALAAQHADRVNGVGIVLNGDGLFCVDLDGVRNPATGELTDVARDIVDTFTGGAVEASQSGEGVHVFGMCNPEALGPHLNKFFVRGQKVEFYTDKRFIAFGGGEFHGDAARDFTAELSRFVPARKATEAELPVGRDPSWSGPEDDDELLRRIRSWTGGPRGAFGEKPPFDALWNADASVLCQYFPSEGDVFDHSSADLSLMSMLAFATGRDAARMERLFSRSALAKRDKWTRGDYRQRTIAKACAGCATVYSETKREVPLLAPGVADLPLVTGASFHGKAIPEQVWLIDQIAAANQPCVITGDGGLGKSSLALDLAVAVATGGKWLSRTVAHGPALYFSAEDELDEVHRRLAKICFARGIPLSALDNVHIAPMAGLDSMLVVSNRGELRTTDLWAALSQRVETLRPAIVILDSLADVYGWNEIVKVEVRTFVGMLRALGLRTNTTFVILMHPSLTGLATGTGLSGNVAWNNSVRSRMFLREPDKAGPADKDFRVLEVMKNNRGERGLQIRLRYQSGVFVDVAGGKPKPFEEADIDNLVLRLVAEQLELGVRLTAGATSNGLPNYLADEPEVKEQGLETKALRASMKRLLRAKRLVQVEARKNGRTGYYLAPPPPEGITTEGDAPHSEGN